MSQLALAHESILAWRSVWTGTILALLLFPRRPRMVGQSVSSDRSRASTASALEILSPARHSIRNSNRAGGLEPP